MQAIEEIVEAVELGYALSPAKGEFRCAECGYGVVVTHSLPSCPMCSEQVWERVAWTPLSRLAP